MNVFHRVTRQTLRENKTRTLVTIIGIILSAAMFTAVTTSISSLQDFLRRSSIYQMGDWHVSYEAMNASDMDNLRDDSLVESVTYAQELGYGALEGLEAPYPYVYVLGGDGDFFSTMSVHVTEGRLPETSSELLIPEYLPLYTDLDLSIGAEISLDLGGRFVDGDPLYQHNPYLDGEGGSDQEDFLVRETRTYTIVGYCQRPGFEDYSAPGISVFTVWDDEAPTQTVSAWFRLNSPGDAFDFASGDPIDGQVHGVDSAGGASTNADLLMSEGYSRYDNFYRVLYNMAAILMAIILFGSVSLIYNAFSISVSERTRQFGLLSSIGATRKQIRGMVMMEAFYVSIVGIPLGILAGMAGIGVTLHLIGGKFASLMAGGESGLTMYLVVSPAAIAIAAAVAFVTVLISAWIPSRRAMRVPAMEAIRQTGDVKLTKRQVHISPLTYKLFGLEGMLAQKHYKRSRRRYRATVLSLFMSVVLFISASSFCRYMTDAVQGTFEGTDYHISYSWYVPADSEETEDLTPEEVQSAFAGVDGITKTSSTVATFANIVLTYDQMPEETGAFLRESGIDAMGNGYDTTCYLTGVDEVTYRAYLKEQGLSESEYLDTETPKAVVLAESRIFDPNEERMRSMQILDESVSELTLPIRNLERYTAFMEAHDASSLSEDEWNELNATCNDFHTFRLGAQVTELPFGLNLSERWGVYLVYPMEYLEKVLAPSYYTYTTYFLTDGHEAAMGALTDAADQAGIPSDGLYDAYATSETDRNLVLIIKVFAYGFITLISLISLANVFNTISTNLLLRRREFAMLESVGMTRGGFRRMLNYECLLYGCKSLVFGLPVSVGVTYLIYKSVSLGYETGFYLPWSAVAIAVGSVFLVVFATMMYGMRKIQKGNPIDDLRRENL